VANFDLAGGMVVTPANEYVFAGTNASFLPYYGNIVKLDNTGSVLWAKAYTGGIATTFNDIKNVSAGGFIVCGSSSSGGAILIRIDNNGNIIWANRYLLPDLSGKSSNEFFNAVIETSDGGFLAVGGVDYFWDGISASTVDTTSFFAVKVNSSGALQWSRVWTIGTGNTDENYFTDCAESSNGYLLVGMSSDLSQSPTDGDYPRDGFLIKVNKTTGANIYVNRFGNGNTTSQIINGVITLSSGHFLIGGSDDVHAFVARLDGTSGSVSQLFGRRINGSAFPPTQYVIQDLMENADGNYSFIGWRIAGLIPTLNSAIIKMNSGSGAIIFGKTYAPIGLSSILPEGGLVPSDQGYFFVSTDQQITGFNYNVIRTDNNGDIGLSVTGCTNTSINPGTTSYNITFQSIITSSYAPATVSSFAPIVTNLSPTTTVHCLNCNISVVPTLTATPNPICAGQSATIVVTNTVSGYNYNVFTSASGGTAIGSAPLSVSPSTTTTYYVEVQSQNNVACVSSTRTPVTVSVTPSPTVTLVATPNPVCAGSTLTLSASGSATSYTWNGPSGFTSTSSNTVISNINLSNNGTYTLVASASGCSTTSVISVTVSPVPSPTASANSPLCAGTTLSLNALPNGLSSYSWSGPASFNSTIQNPTIGNISPTQSGTYSLTVTNSANCTATATVSVTVNPNPSVSATAIGTITCTNPTIQVIGTTTTSPVNYTWSGNGIISGANSATAIVNQSGTYTLTITSSSGCSASTTVDVSTDASIPDISVTVTDTITCSSPTISVIGTSTSTPVSYSWTGNGIISGANSATAIVNGNSGYTLTVTNTSNGCSSTTLISVPVNTTPPTVNAGNNQTLTCSSASVVLVGTASPSTVTPNWLGGVCGSTNSFTTSACTAGIYTLTVTNPQNGCVNQSTVQVFSDVSAPVVSLVNSGTINCITSTVQITATTTATPVSYTWNGPGIVSGNGTASITVNSPGTYYVTVTNTLNGCSSTNTIDVLSDMSFTISITGQSMLCSGQTATLTANGASSYTWSTGDTTPSISITPSVSTSYSVSGIYGSCTGTTAVNITVNNNPTITVSPTSYTIQITGTVPLLATGADTYTWIPADNLSNPNIPNPVASPMNTTNYCVWGYNTAGCADSACVKIVVDTNCGELFVPNIFSPNSDGNNDELCVYGTLCIVKEYLFAIYDRWGEKVFETTDKNTCWDGTYKGKNLNNATFVYYLKGIKYDNTTIEKRGNITIIK